MNRKTMAIFGLIALAMVITVPTALAQEVDTNKAEKKLLNQMLRQIVEQQRKQDSLLEIKIEYNIKSADFEKRMLSIDMDYDRKEIEINKKSESLSDKMNDNDCWTMIDGKHENSNCKEISEAYDAIWKEYSAIYQTWIEDRIEAQEDYASYLDSYQEKIRAIGS